MPPPRYKTIKNLPDEAVDALQALREAKSLKGIESFFDSQLRNVFKTRAILVFTSSVCLLCYVYLKYVTGPIFESIPTVEISPGLILCTVTIFLAGLLEGGICVVHAITWLVEWDAARIYWNVCKELELKKIDPDEVLKALVTKKGGVPVKGRLSFGLGMGWYVYDELKWDWVGQIEGDPKVQMVFVGLLREGVKKRWGDELWEHTYGRHLDNLNLSDPFFVTPRQEEVEKMGDPYSVGIKVEGAEPVDVKVDLRFFAPIKIVVVPDISPPSFLLETVDNRRFHPGEQNVMIYDVKSLKEWTSKSAIFFTKEGHEVRDVDR